MIKKQINNHKFNVRYHNIYNLKNDNKFDFNKCR